MTVHKGQVGGVRYEVDNSVVERMRDTHGIDAIKEIEDALSKFNKQEKDTDASKSITE